MHGHKVAGFTNGGAFAEEIVINHAACFPIPSGVDMRQAAAFPVAYGTSHVALVHRARLHEGQSVLVLGAAGGVGMAAVQIAKAVGAKVVAVARGEDKIQALREAGAEQVIDSANLGGKSLKELVMSEFPNGVDVLYDPVGGASFKEGLRCLRWGGHALVIGFASGEIPRLPMNLALVKNLTVHGVYWGAHAVKDKATLVGSLRALVRMLGKGQLPVRISAQDPMDCAHEAFGHLASRRAIGKVVIDVRRGADVGAGGGMAKL